MKKRVIFLFALITALLALLTIYTVRKITDTTVAITVVSPKENSVWEKETRLNIFDNGMLFHNKDKIIYPGASGTYKFYVKNKTKEDIKYYLTLYSISDMKINLKYRLRTEEEFENNKKTEWKTINELDSSNILNSKENELYYLEWKWEDSETDTEIGLNGDFYKLYLIVSYEVKKGM